jgi:hypothetical protein
MELYLALRRRGFLRVATAATCRIPKGQHSVGLIAGHNSLQAIEAALAETSPFLCTSAAIAVLIDSGRSAPGCGSGTSWSNWASGSKPGVRCREGFVLSAIRRGFGQMENAA